MSKEKEDLRKREESTLEVYERWADSYDRNRDRSLFEKEYIDLFLDHISNSLVTEVTEDGLDILDLGCGAGEPIASYLISQGHKVTGADYSQSMLSICRKRYPDHHWIFCDMRDYKLVDKKYEGIISWGAFFHLNHEQQRRNLPLICQSLKAGGCLLLTVGPEEGEVWGEVAGQKVYHASLAPEEYESILKNNNLEPFIFNRNDENCQGFSILMAKKRGSL